MNPEEAFAGPRPTLPSDRLTLRPFAAEDAARVRELAGVRELAEMTLTVPHPYPEGAAEAWIESHEPAWAARTRLPLAVTTPGDGIVGAAGLQFALDNGRAELGYWVGLPFWGRGYATEASRTLLAYGFEELGLHRIVAHHFTRNPASGRVLQNVGMQHEGRLRQHVLKWGAFEDLECYGILRSEWVGGAGERT